MIRGQSCSLYTHYLSLDFVHMEFNSHGLLAFNLDFNRPSDESFSFFVDASIGFCSPTAAVSCIRGVKNM